MTNQRNECNARNNTQSQSQTLRNKTCENLETHDPTCPSLIFYTKNRTNSPAKWLIFYIMLKKIDKASRTKIFYSCQCKPQPTIL